MITLTGAILLFNGLSLMVALGALLILTIFLKDSPPSVFYFSLFMLAMILWAGGSFVSRTTVQVGTEESLIRAGVWAIEIGFGAACAMSFLMVAYFTQMGSRTIWLAALIAIITAIVSRVALVLLDVSPSYTITDEQLLAYQFPSLNRWVYAAFALGTMGIAWRNQAKFERYYVSWAFFILGVSQLLALLSPRLRSLAFAEIVASMTTVLIVYGIVQTEVIDPFLRRTRQVSIVQDIGVAITNLRVDKVLETIAAQAASLLDARGGAIYLLEDDVLSLAAVHNLPDHFVNQTKIPLGQGVVGKIAEEQQASFINHYWRAMQGQSHEGFPTETVGAVAGVALRLGTEVVGVLLVVEGLDDQFFNTERIQHLQLIAPQAAVTIRNNRLLEHERDLKKQLLEQQTQLRTVLTSTSNPVLAIGRDYRIIFANQAAIDLLGVKHLAHEIEAHDLLELVDPEWLPKPRQMLRSIKLFGVYIYDISFQNRDYLCHLAPLHTAERGWVVILNDVTSLKEVDRLKSQMIRMTSHDLKNPLFSLMTYIELIEEDGEPFFNDTMRRNMSIVWTQLNRMQQLINGILNLERVQIGTSALITVDLKELLTSAIQGVEAMAEARGLELSLQIHNDLANIAGDQQQLLQAITNLLDNAIKFTPKGGKITVEARSDEHEVQVVVSDTGIGIPIEDQAQVFERFFRGERGRAVNDASSGLGLSIVKAVIEQHQGTIALKSNPGEGTHFIVRLPIIREQLPLTS